MMTVDNGHVRVLTRVRDTWVQIPVEFFYFPAGEPHTRLHGPVGDTEVLIDARIGSMEDFIKMLLVTSCVREHGARTVRLHMPFFPGARQDRVEDGSGDPLTVKMFADIVNLQHYDSVTVVDPHSDVTPALLERKRVVDVSEFAPAIATLAFNRGGIDYLICPDSGAEKRVFRMSQKLGVPIVKAWKHRDRDTGKLTGFGIDPLPGPGNYLVVDDICDGGGTFIGLAEVFHQRLIELHQSGVDQDEPTKLGLWVTHGVFSHGLDALCSTFEWIGCADSYPSDALTDERLTVIALVP